MELVKRKKEAPIEHANLVNPKFEGENDYEPPINFSKLVPSGSTYLNCACSDRSHGAFGLGRIVNVIGDSDTGKSVLSLSTIASACTVPLFDDYDMFYRDAESADGFDKKHMFPSLVKRLCDPMYKPNTIEDFYADIMDKWNGRKKFIYVLDSLDSLTSEAEIKRVRKKTQSLLVKRDPGSKKKGKEKKEKGTYGTDIPKAMSSLLRVIKKEISTQESLLIIVSQTRSNIGPSAFFQPRTRSGGDALTFYCTHVMWLGKEKKITDGKYKEELGRHVYVKVTKNKLTGKKRKAFFPIYTNYGIDDIGSCIDFLVETNHWKLRKQTILAEEIGVEGAKKGLISYIEQNNMEGKLRRAMANAWETREKEICLDRKPRFR